jgi:Holliday junction resolvasome RuvABC endonuclease subunit
MGKNMLHVGIDPSVRSPGIALWHAAARRLRVLYLAQHKKPVHVPQRAWVLPQFTLEIMPATPDSAHHTWSDMRRYALIEKTLTRAVHDTGVPADQVHLWMEDYAYGAGGNKSYMLSELGGVLKMAAHRAGWACETMAISTIKKQFTGNGRATKADMWTAWQQRGWPDLLSTFHLQLNKQGEVPTPVQDIVDSVALIAPHLDNVNK